MVLQENAWWSWDVMSFPMWGHKPQQSAINAVFLSINGKFGSIKYSLTRLNIGLLHTSWDRNVYWLLLHRVLVDLYLGACCRRMHHTHTHKANRVLGISICTKIFPRLRLELKASTCWEVSGSQPRPRARPSVGLSRRDLLCFCQGHKLVNAWFRCGLAAAVRSVRPSESLSLLAASCVHRGRPSGLWGVHDNTGAQTSVFWQQGRLPGQHHRQHLLAGEGRRCSLFHTVNNLHHPHRLSSSYLSIPECTPIASLCSSAEQFLSCSSRGMRTVGKGVFFSIEEL